MLLGLESEKHGLEVFCSRITETMLLGLESEKHGLEVFCVVREAWFRGVLFKDPRNLLLGLRVREACSTPRNENRSEGFPRTRLFQSLQTVTARKNTTSIDAQIYPRRFLQTVTARKNTTSIDAQICPRRFLQTVTARKNTTSIDAVTARKNTSSIDDILSPASIFTNNGDRKEEHLVDRW